MNNTNKMNRRDFLTKLMLTASATMIAPYAMADDDDDDKYKTTTSSTTSTTTTNVTFTPVTTNITGKNVVIIGAGMAGATMAKYLRLWGGSGINITLVEPNAQYTSNIMSNLALSAGRTLSSLTVTYSNLISKYAITLKQASLVSFDNTSKQVTLSDGSTLNYDRLVFAPGIQMDDAYGLTSADYATDFPHAWQAGNQTQILANQIFAMQAGDTFLMTIPAKPYRCPPGPYERACLVADYLKTHGKTGSKVVVLDENPSIQAEAVNFGNAFSNIHAGWVDYRAGISNIHIDKATRTVSFTQNGVSNSISAKVINAIPPHRAPSIMTSLCNGGRWAPVNVLSYESTVTGMAGVHIIGDASQTTQPKAGHIANQEAKVCADAIIRAFQNQAPDPAPLTNSACYSPITNSTASWLTGVYQYDTSSKTMRLWSNGAFTDAAVEADSISSKNFSNMNTWFTTLMSDSFS